MRESESAGETPRQKVENLLGREISHDFMKDINKMTP